MLSLLNHFFFFFVDIPPSRRSYAAMASSLEGKRCAEFGSATLLSAEEIAALTSQVNDAWTVRDSEGRG